MKRVPCLVLSVSLFYLISPSRAQEPLTRQHAPDGGTMVRFSSIVIPSTASAPFTATVNAEWIRHLPDGSNITLVNHRTVARDANGRIYQERAYFVPNDGKHESYVAQIEISDPTASQIYICQVAERVCRLREFSPKAGPEFAVVAPGKVGTPGLTVENLGKQTVAGLETVGTRETHVVEAAAIGNDAPIFERREFWYSPQLGINLITKREDPRFSSQQNFEVTNVSLGEPDAKLFDLPAGFKIIDLRNPPERLAGSAPSPE